MAMEWWYQMPLQHWQTSVMQSKLFWLTLVFRGKVIQMNQALLHKLLNAVPECSEWGRVYILDFIAENIL
jgi:hypothetical protein